MPAIRVAWPAERTAKADVDRTALRRSLIGAVVAGGLFGAVSLYRSVVSGGPLLDYLGPIGLMVVIGATVGGLVGPLLGEAWIRRKRRAAEPRPGPARPPLWVTLIVGAAVGLGAGVAWSLPWVGVAFGLVLALSARRVFR